MSGTAVSLLKRMRLPLLAAIIGMVCILTLDLFVFDPTDRDKREAPGVKARDAQAEAEARQDKKEELTMLFSQEMWENVDDEDDWDAVFDQAAWSSLLNEGYVGANVKDEPKLKRVKPPPGSDSGAAVIPKDGAMTAKEATQVSQQKAVISLGIGGSPADMVSGKSKKKLKKGKKEPPAEFEKFTDTPSSDKKATEWFETSYKKSATYGKANAFVEDEPLFATCGASVVATRAWGETYLSLGPFRYLPRSKNPCWYADNNKFTCIPYFFLTGVAGPATDDVMQKILIHPDVIGHQEQVFWWDLGRHAGTSWETYCDSFQSEADEILLDISSQKSANKVFGDATASYFSSPTGWERLSSNENCDEPRITLASHIRRLRVKGLVIVVLPHPTRRLIADYRQENKARLSPSQFHEDVKEAIAVYKKCFASFSLRQCAYNRTLADSVEVSLHEGFYSIYMEDWIRIFPPEQFLVMRFEDYATNIVPVLNKIYDFLNLAQIEPTELSIAADPTASDFRDLVLSHNPAGLQPETVAMLNSFYQPFLDRLGQIMGDADKFTWKDSFAGSPASDLVAGSGDSTE